MSHDPPIQTDVRDMYGIHDTFRRGLREARGQLDLGGDGDRERAEFFSAYLDELFWLLHTHHEGEDLLLYPLLEERLPEQKELLERIDSQHAGVTSKLDAAKSALSAYRATGSSEAAGNLADECESLLETLDAHLVEEETAVLPLVERYVTPAEWDRLPEHAFSQYRGTRVWLPFGLAREEMPDDIQRGMTEGEWPLSVQWREGGAAAFEAEMRAIRGSSG